MNMNKMLDSFALELRNKLNLKIISNEKPLSDKCF